MATESIKEVEAFRYTGGADRRVITKDQWAKAKADDQTEDVVWDEDNEYTVPASSLSEKAQALLSKKDSGFSKVKVKA